MSFSLFLNRELVRFFTFVVIGLINTFLDTFLWHFLAKFFEKQQIYFPFNLTRYAVAHSISFLVSASSSFFMNKFWTWRDSVNDNFLEQFFKFYLVASFSLLIGTLLMNFLTKKQPKFLIENFSENLQKTESKNYINFFLQQKYWPLICKLLTIGVTTFTNYFGYKIFVF